MLRLPIRSAMTNDGKKYFYIVSQEGNYTLTTKYQLIKYFYELFN